MLISPEGRLLCFFTSVIMVWIRQRCYHRPFQGTKFKLLNFDTTKEGNLGDLVGDESPSKKKVMSRAFFSVCQVKRQRQTLILKHICPEMYTGNLRTFMTWEDLESTGFKQNYNLKWLDWVLVWMARRDRSKCSGLVVRCSLENHTHSW